MGNVRMFAAVNTKIRVLKGRMLTNEDFMSLLSKKSVGEIITYLKDNTSYGEVLKGQNINTIHRGDLELILKRYIVSQYEKLIHYFTGQYRSLFRTLFVRFEIEDLKLYIRALARTESIDHIRNLVVYSGEHSTVNHDTLSQSRTIEGFVENLKGTIYYRVLKPFLNEEDRKLVFYMEMVLDRLYFRMLYEEARKLDRNDKEIFMDLFGKNVDLLNLEWIYRGLKYFGLSPEELINYTLPGGYEIKYKDIKELCYSKTERQLMDRMLDTRYGFLFDNEATLDLLMERRIERYLYFQFLEFYRREKMNIIQSIAYLHLIEYEVRDISAITEAIRYGLNREDAKKYLIRRIEGGDHNGY